MSRGANVSGGGGGEVAAVVWTDRGAGGNGGGRGGIAFNTERDRSEKPEVVELVAGEVRAVNGDLAAVEQVKRFRLIPKELDHEEGELTATQKVKRAIMQDRLRDLIDALYAPAR